MDNFNFTFCTRAHAHYSNYITQRCNLGFGLQGAQKISIPYTPNKPMTVKQILR